MEGNRFMAEIPLTQGQSSLYAPLLGSLRTNYSYEVDSRAIMRFICLVLTGEWTDKWYINA